MGDREIYEDARRNLGRSRGHMERPGEIQEDPGWEMQRDTLRLGGSPGRSMKVKEGGEMQRKFLFQRVPSDQPLLRNYPLQLLLELHKELNLFNFFL
jgi:hypothetical protein